MLTVSEVVVLVGVSDKNVCTQGNAVVPTSDAQSSCINLIPLTCTRYGGTRDLDSPLFSGPWQAGLRGVVTNDTYFQGVLWQELNGPG